MAEKTAKTITKKVVAKPAAATTKPATKEASIKPAVTAAKPVAKKPAAKAPAVKAKPVAKKPAAVKKPVVAKPAAAKPAAKSSAKTMVVSDEQRYRMVAEAAYYRAESNQFKSDPVRDWIEAESDIATLLSVSK